MGWKTLEQQREYARKWRVKNRNRINQKARDDYRKNKKKIQKRQKKWYDENREEILKRREDRRGKNREQYRQYGRDYYHRHKEEIKAEYQRKRQELLNLIGNSCVVCGSKEKLVIHEIHGKKHPMSCGRTNIYFNYVKLHVSDFATLCRRCHREIHYLATKNRKKAIELVKDIQKG